MPMPRALRIPMLIALLSATCMAAEETLLTCTRETAQCGGSREEARVLRQADGNYAFVYRFNKGKSTDGVCPGPAKSTEIRVPNLECLRSKKTPSLFYCDAIIWDDDQGNGEGFAFNTAIVTRRSASDDGGEDVRESFVLYSQYRPSAHLKGTPLKGDEVSADRAELRLELFAGDCK
jgi:hypothetical protein